MTILVPDLTWPTGIAPYENEMILGYKSTPLESPITGAQQILKRQGVMWLNTMAFRLERARAQRFEAFLDKCEGMYNTVSVHDFANPLPLGPNEDRADYPVTEFDDETRFDDGTAFSGGDGNVVLWGGHVKGATSLLTDGWKVGTQLYAGDTIELAYRKYRLREDLVSDDVGRARAYISPNLRNDVSHLSLVTRIRATTIMRLIDDEQSKRNVKVGELYLFNLAFREAL